MLKLIDLVQISSDPILNQLYVTLPQTILEIKNDSLRTELLTKIDEALNRAIEEKNVSILPFVFKELHLLYSEYSN